MATWVTHLIIADGVLSECPELDRRGFCVGNIAPDCNVENETWTAFIPSREVTHWMGSQRKNAADCSRFYEEYCLPHAAVSSSREEKSFLLGYYAHLIADAEFQRYIRDEKRVQAAWNRIKADAAVREQARGMEETWDSVKKLIPRQERAKEIEAIEAEYLRLHPDSGYLTEILPLQSFPDYIDYLPQGAIVRKIGIMGVLPSAADKPLLYLAMSKEEYAQYVKTASALVLRAVKSAPFLP